VLIEARSKLGFLGADGVLPRHDDIVEWREVEMPE
jgi:hypothetical protein